MLGVTHGNALIAYGMVAYPTPFDTIDIGQFLSVVPTENLSDVAIMASTMVHPDYRCCGWHKLLLRSRENLAIANGKHIFVAEVSLSNWVTRCNLLRGGYFIEGCTDIDDQRRRHIFKRDVRQTRHFEPDEHAPDKVDQLAFERQRELIERGYVGVADSRPAHSIIYKKLGKQSNQGSWQ
jgi:hypothetical protein